MALALLLLYPITFAAGWLGWFWFVVVPPVVVFVFLNLKNAAVAQRMKTRFGIGDEDLGEFLRGAGRPVLPVTLWNGVLYGIALLAGWGIHRMFS
ncbi:MAG: hypothetical protein JWP49_566 [Phenylobacterium sp.]|nr:hypothetical protein [Phenylobacterium sp.]